ncbi:MAG TPA: RsmG family class I SAM-dependent methyltransferase, partial [Actinomycetota bacterium]|nr:RsmG family class I SAM-dependent methyltransferase [Actinomycetota bacterium]
EPGRLTTPFGPREGLVRVLERAHRLGFIGDPPLAAHLDHAQGYAAAWDTEGGVPAGPGMAADLGSGGGLPALPLVLHWPASRWVLIEAGDRRAAFLESAVRDLDLGDRVVVRHERAEDAGRDPDLRAGCDLVTARSFGGPPVTAECAAPLLRVGGLLLVSEPPVAEPDRWPTAGLAELGFRRGASIDGPPALQVLHLESACPPRYPRRVGVPGKRPLW